MVVSNGVEKQTHHPPNLADSGEKQTIARYSQVFTHQQSAVVHSIITINMSVISCSHRHHYPGKSRSSAPELAPKWFYRSSNALRRLIAMHGNWRLDRKWPGNWPTDQKGRERKKKEKTEQAKSGQCIFGKTRSESKTTTVPLSVCLTVSQFAVNPFAVVTHRWPTSAVFAAVGYQLHNGQRLLHTHTHSVCLPRCIFSVSVFCTTTIFLYYAIVVISLRLLATFSKCANININISTCMWIKGSGCVIDKHDDDVHSCALIAHCAVHCAHWSECTELLCLVASSAIFSQLCRRPP